MLVFVLFCWGSAFVCWPSGCLLYCNLDGNSFFTRIRCPVQLLHTWRLHPCKKKEGASSNAGRRTESNDDQRHAAGHRPQLFLFSALEMIVTRTKLPSLPSKARTFLGSVHECAELQPSAKDDLCTPHASPLVQKRSWALRASPPAASHSFLSVAMLLF